MGKRTQARETDAPKNTAVGTALALATSQGEQVNPVAEAVSYMPILQPVNIVVNDKKTVVVSADLATQVRSVVTMASSTLDKYRSLWPKIEAAFGPKAFERGTEEYSGVTFLLASVHPRWKEKPARTDTSQEAETARYQRKHCQIIAQQGIGAMIKYRDEADETQTTRAKTAYSAKMRKTIDAIKRVAESSKTPETEKKQALRDYAVLQAARNGMWERLRSVMPILPKPLFDFIESGKPLPADFKLIEAHAKLSAEEVEAPELAVAGKRDVGAEGRKAGTVTVTNGEPAQA